MALPNQGSLSPNQGKGSLSPPIRARAGSRCPNPTAADEILLLFLSPNAQAGHPFRLLFLSCSSPNAQAGHPSRRNVDLPSRTVRQSYGPARPTVGPSLGQMRQSVGPTLGSERPSVGPLRG